MRIVNRADNRVTGYAAPHRRPLGGVMTRSNPADNAFTTVELMTVVGIIGILVVMAVPLYVSAQVKSAQSTCFSNQRYIEGTVNVWVSGDPTRSLSGLAGVVGSSHPLVADGIFSRVPRCPDGGEVTDPDNPTPEEGAYTLQPSGLLQPCTYGELGEHGHY